MDVQMSRKPRRGLSISIKMYLFVTLTVLVVAIGTATISYLNSANQIDAYFKRLAFNSAENFASLVDVDFYIRMKEVAQSEEYQELREKAEEAEDEKMAEDYFRKVGIWDDYVKNRAFLTNYLSHMDDLTYLYCVVFGDKDAKVDMYVMDDDSNPVYEVGYFEDREEAFYGVDATKQIEPTISYGDWGWLCSAYAPVYDADGNLVCHIGCDVSMDEIMAERRHYLLLIAVGSVILALLVLVGAILFARHFIVNPLNAITNEMKRFHPSEGLSYEEAGVIEMKPRSRDEIHDIYLAVRSMEINITDYLNELSLAKKDRAQVLSSLEKAQSDIRTKEQQINHISEQAQRDALTSVGNKAAYLRKTEELTARIAEGKAEFAVVMVDMNDLKRINDEYGHRAGDQYIKGCCHIVCQIFKHSPVFRIGGDEFVIILEGDDYQNREVLTALARNTFMQSYLNTDAQQQERYAAAVGMSAYAAGDNSVEAVFRRADDIMYEDKKKFKEAFGTYR